MSEYRLSQVVGDVTAVICESLEKENRDFGLSTALMEDLGAESLDYLDIIFRLEKKFGIKIERGRIERDVRQKFPDMNIKQNTPITPEIATELKALLPELPAATIDRLEKFKELAGTFTIATFVRFTIRGLLDSDAGAQFVQDIDVGYSPEQLGIAA
jgi:acyl carrier protein